MANMRESIKTLRSEAESALRTLCALRQFKYFLVSQDCVTKINENVYFWNILESSLLTKLFIAIRRIFDNAQDSFNFQAMVNECKANISDFQPAGLELRKMEGHTTRPSWLNDYISSAYTPTENDFNALSKLVRQSSKKMDGAYKHAASKIFAHAIHTDVTIINNQLSQLDFDEIETALDAVWHFYEQVWQLYENGKKPSLEISAYPYKQEVYDSVIKQLGVAL